MLERRNKGNNYIHIILTGLRALKLVLLLSLRLRLIIGRGGHSQEAAMTRETQESVC